MHRQLLNSANANRTSPSNLSVCCDNMQNFIHKRSKFAGSMSSKAQNQSGNTATGKHKDKKLTAFTYVSLGACVLVERHGGEKL